MKNLFVILSLFFFTSLFAQQEMHWRAVYQYKRILNEKQKARRDSLLKAQPAMADMMKKLYKRFDNRTFFLDFNTNESVYNEKQKLAKPGNGINIRSNKPRTLYKNIQEKIYYYQRPTMQKDYIIKDTLPDYHWKITGETKKIGNYTVIKAEGIEKTRKLKKTKKGEKPDPGKMEFEEVEKKFTAWFTPELPIKNGPGKYWGLPGLIMEVDKDGEVYLLKELIINPKNFNEIKKPEKGKVITKKEYDELVKKERERMRKMFKNRRNKKGDINIRINM